jgi:hypothetical protein
MKISSTLKTMDIPEASWGNLQLEKRLKVVSKHPLRPNPPEADKFLCLPCEMPAQLNLHLTFNRGAAYFSGVGPRDSIH